MERPMTGSSPFSTPGDRELYEALNGRIFLRAPQSITHLGDINPARIGKALVARKVYRDIMNRREDKGVYSWTLCTLPTPELARQAGCSLKQYTDQIVRACYLDKRDPVKEWDRIYKEVGAIKKWLNSLKVKSLHVQSRHTDLRITPGEKRKWLGVSGHNMPSFEIFLSPDWRGTEGVYFADQPSFRSGNYVSGVKLLFKKGSVIRTEADKGKGFIDKQLAMDRGAARVGEFSLTDRRYSRIDRFMADTLFDENFGGKFGNCHLAVGLFLFGYLRREPGRPDGSPEEEARFQRFGPALGPRQYGRQDGHGGAQYGRTAGYIRQGHV